MSKIIVSYRRADSQAVAGRIVDRLIAHFGPDAVFMDVDNIPFGIDFRDHIQSVLSKAAVMITIVGAGWLGVDPDGHRRIDDEDDPVRVELETALRQKLLVIPVLVNNATMPKASALPDALHGFSFLNAAPVDVGRDFRPHVDRLIHAIETVLATGADSATHERSATHAETAKTLPPARSASPISLAIAGGAVLLAIVGAGALWFGAANTGSTAAPASSAAAAVSVAAVSVASPEAVSAPLPVTAPVAVPEVAHAAAAPSARPRPDTASEILPMPSSTPGLVIAQSSAPPPAAAPASADDIRWDVLKDTTDVGLLIHFIEQYPDSKHKAEAEQRITTLAQKSPPQPVAPSQATVTPAPPPAPADPTDEKDWASVQKTNSYEAYQAYVRRHPQSAHVAEAIKAALASALIAEPGIGHLPTGETVLVDDRICDANHIKAITGGDVNKGISRIKKCVPRSNPF